MNKERVKDQKKREPYSKPMLHTHEPLRNLTALGSGIAPTNAPT